MGGVSLHFVMKTQAICIKWITCCSEAKQDTWRLSPNTEVFIWHHPLALSWMWCWKPWSWHMLLRSYFSAVSCHMNKHLLSQTRKQSHISHQGDLMLDQVHCAYQKGTSLLRSRKASSKQGNIKKNKNKKTIKSNS